MKIKRIIQQYENEFVETPAGELYCKLCDTVVSHEKQFRVEQHRKTSKHQRHLERLQSTSSRHAQTFLTPISSDFTDKVVAAFSSADIPLYKLRNPSLRKLFEDIRHPLPSETSCRNRVADLAEQKLIQIKNLIKGAGAFFLVVDESEVKGNRYVLVLIGSINAPSRTFVIDCVSLSQAPDSDSITRIIDDVVVKFGVERDEFALLITDAARYMTCAAATLKILYPRLLHITCIAHLLHNCALKVKNHFEHVDQLIARIKASTVKNRTREILFHSIGSPPLPVVTRWGSWINAALYYADHLTTVREIVRNFLGDGITVTRAKNVVEEQCLATDLANISRCYKSLAELILKLESAEYTIIKASSDLRNLDFGTDPCKIKEYLTKRLAVHEMSAIVDASRKDISPANYALLQNCQPTSASVERGFSILKKMLAKDRAFDPTNVKNYFILRCNP